MSDKVAADLSSVPVEAKITDEAVAQARGMIGLYLRPEGPYLQDVSPDTSQNFCNGIGDVNPLYRDIERGRKSHLGSLVAHPMFPYAYGWPGRTRWGLPGVHGFYAGNDWEFFRHLRPDDRVTCIEKIVGVEERESKFSGRLVLQYVEASFFNQRQELIARVLGWCTRHERKAARDQGKYSDVKLATYTADQYREFMEIGLQEFEDIQGSKTRYFEDVHVGDSLPSIVRGPLSLMDTMGFLVGCGRGHTHGIVLKEAVSHPGHWFRNPKAGGGLEYTGIGHHRDEVAKDVGVPGTYDYGPQRTAWLCSLVTNWMGDQAFVKRVRAEMRRFNTVGDTTWCKGKITRKYEKDGHKLVDIEIWAENQSGDVTAPGIATVILPSKALEARPRVDGSALELGLPIVR